jgi:hypothetical protein
MSSGAVVSSNIPTAYYLNEQTALDLSAIRAGVESDWMTWRFRGAWVDLTRGLVCQRQWPNVPTVPPPDGTGLAVEFHQDFFNCLLRLWSRLGQLQSTILAEQIPPNSPVQLNTSNNNLRNLIPSLFAAYPNRALALKVRSLDNMPLQLLFDDPAYPGMPVVSLSGWSVDWVGRCIVCLCE